MTSTTCQRTHQRGHTNLEAVKPRLICTIGEPLTRQALHAIFTIAFICMLRSDEVLKIWMEHMEILPTKVTLTLPFRKTHQFGDKSCFISFH